MNKIFKVVYNKTLGSWVAVNEFARGYCKNVSTKKLIASLALSGMAMGVLAQTTTVDLTTLRFDPTVSGAPTDPNGPWGDNAGEGPIVAGAGETVNVTGSLENAVDNYKNKYAIINYYPHEKNDRFKNAVLPQDWEKIKDYVWNPDINDYGPKADNYVFDPKKSVVYEDSVTKSKTTI